MKDANPIIALFTLCILCSFLMTGLFMIKRYKETNDNLDFLSLISVYIYTACVSALIF